MLMYVVAVNTFPTPEVSRVIFRTELKAVNYLCKKAPSQLFDWAQNMLLSKNASKSY